MSNDCSVELLTSAYTSAQLKELDCIRTVRHSLIALRAHLTRTFKWVIWLPVLLARCLFHQHKRLIFESTHQIMLHCDQTPWCIIRRIIIPGDHIHFLCPFEIIKSFKGSHHICSDRCLFVKFTDCFFFHLEVIQHSVWIKATIINR